MHLHDAIQGPLAPSALDRSATIDALPGVVGAAQSSGPWLFSPRLLEAVTRQSKASLGDRVGLVLDGRRIHQGVAMMSSLRRVVSPG